MSDTLNTQPSFHSELSLSHAYAELTDDVLKEKALHYTFIERDETLNDRQRLEVVEILDLLMFEVAYRGMYKIRQNGGIQ
jgi:hypothetical protein